MTARIVVSAASDQDSCLARFDPRTLAVETALACIARVVPLGTHERIAVTRALDDLADDLDRRRPDPWD
jgi:hypothetical protein